MHFAAIVKFPEPVPFGRRKRHFCFGKSWWYLLCCTHVAHHLHRELCKHTLGQFNWISATLSEWDKLDDIAHSLLPVRSKQRPCIRVEFLHIAEVLLSDANDDDG